MQATLAQAAGEYRERPVSGPLSAYFRCLWVHTLPTVETSPIVVVPDGCVDLQWIDGVLRVAGPDREAQTEVHAPGTKLLGLRFHPAIAPAWLGVPASDVLNQRVPLEDLWGVRARRLSERLGQPRDAEHLIQELEGAMAPYHPLPTLDRRDMRVAFDILAIGAPPDRSLIPWLVDELGLTERTLRRRFAEVFGYSPKTLDRILRFQRFLRLTRTNRGASVASLAAEAGYADQAHLVRESRRLAGAAPREIVYALGG